MSGDEQGHTGEARYTLAEAAREIARRDCDEYGHDWDVIATIGTGPARLICIRCGWSGDVKMGTQP